MKPSDKPRLSVRMAALTIALTLMVSAVFVFGQKIAQRDDRPGFSLGVRVTEVPPSLDLETYLRDQYLTQTPPPGPAHPARLRIEHLSIDVLVVTVTVDPSGFLVTPNRFAGYWSGSAPLEAGGNTVIVGHSSAEPRPVFRELGHAAVADMIAITDQFGRGYRYQVRDIVTIHRLSQDAATDPIRYVEPTPREQLTLLTCYPDEGCAGRLIVIALPIF